MKQCPKCGKIYDDSWEVCLECSMHLVSSGLPDSEKEKLRKSEESVSKKKQKINVFAGGILIFLCSFFTVLIIDVLGFNPSTYSFSFCNKGIYSILIAIRSFAVPWGIMSLIMLWKGKKALSEKPTIRNTFYILFFTILIFVIFGTFLYLYSFLKNT